jgi:hypothetical protein
MNTKTAVVDKFTQESLMAMAAEEDLLLSTKETDGVYERIIGAQVNPVIKQQLLEQIVLTPQIAFNNCPQFLWESLDGPLIDKNNLANLDDEYDNDNLEKVTYDILSGMLIGAGHQISVAEIQRRYNAVQKALQEQEEYTKKTGKEPPSEIRRIILESCDVEDEYDPEEYKAQRLRNEVFSSFRPILHAFEEFQRVSHVASKYGYVLRIPIVPQGHTDSFLNPDSKSHMKSNDFVLFRIVADGLGKLTYRPTLRESIKLANDPATIALRECLSVWQKELLNTDVDAVIKIQSEIKKATKALSKLNTINNVGTITTWLSAPVSLFEFFLGLPPILGVSVGLAGKGTSAISTFTKTKYRWAMYANT